MKKVLATLLSAAILCGGYATNVKARHTREHKKNNGKQNHCSSCGFSLFKTCKYDDSKVLEPKASCDEEEKASRGEEEKASRGEEEKQSCKQTCNRCGCSHSKQGKNSGGKKGHMYAEKSAQGHGKSHKKG